MQKPHLKNNKQGGQAMIILVVFFLFIAFSASLGLVGSIYIQHKIIGDETIDSKRSFFVSEVGVEDIMYRLKKGWSYTTDADGVADWDSGSDGPDEWIMVSSNWSDTDVQVLSATQKKVEARGTAFYRARFTEVILDSTGCPSACVWAPSSWKETKN